MLHIFPEPALSRSPNAKKQHFDLTVVFFGRIIEIRPLWGNSLATPGRPIHETSSASAIEMLARESNNSEEDPESVSNLGARQSYYSEMVSFHFSCGDRGSACATARLASCNWLSRVLASPNSRIQSLPLQFSLGTPTLSDHESDNQLFSAQFANCWKTPGSALSSSPSSTNSAADDSCFQAAGARSPAQAASSGADAVPELWPTQPRNKIGTAAMAEMSFGNVSPPCLPGKSPALLFEGDMMRQGPARVVAQRPAAIEQKSSQIAESVTPAQATRSENLPPKLLHPQSVPVASACHLGCPASASGSGSGDGHLIPSCTPPPPDLRQSTTHFSSSALKTHIQPSGKCVGVLGDQKQAPMMPSGAEATCAQPSNAALAGSAAIVMPAAQSKTEEKFEEQQFKSQLLSMQPGTVPPGPVAHPSSSLAKFQQRQSPAPTGKPDSIPRTACTTERVFTAAFADEVLSQPIVLLDKFLEACGTDGEAFSIETLERECSKATIDVLHQPCVPDSGWDLPLQSSYQVQLGRYMPYVRSCMKGSGPLLCVDAGDHEWVQFVLNPNTNKHYGTFSHHSVAGKLKKAYLHRTGRHLKVPPHPSASNERVDPASARQLGLLQASKPHVQYAVNIDLKDDLWQRQVAALQNSLPPWMAACGMADAFRLSPQKVDGMNCPQLYIKVAGSWTGTHEENNRFYSVNHNHGPAPSEWGAIAPQHVAKLREAVRIEMGIDILAAEGRYIPDPKFCAKHSIPVMLGRQRAGDTVVLQGGTLHWVKAMGVAVHSSWNYAPFRAETFQAAIARRNINASMRPAYPSYVPVSTLCLNVAAELLGHQPLKSLTMRNIERVLLEAALAKDAQCQPNMSAPESMLLLPGAARTLPELLRLIRVLLSEVEMQILQHTAHEAALVQQGFTLEREPPSSQVYRCQNVSCHRELFSIYVLCETCHEAGQSAFNTATKSSRSSEEDTARKREHKGPKFYVTPPPGRTDVSADVQSKLCVPSLVGVEAAKSMAADSAKEIPAMAISVTRLNGCRKRRRGWRDGDFAATGAVTCAPIMCVPCAMSHASVSGGYHTLQAMYKFKAGKLNKVARRLREVSDLLSTAIKAQKGQ